MIEKNAKTKQIASKVCIFAVFLLLAMVSVYLYSPVIRTNAEGSNIPTQEKRTEVEFISNPNISLALSNNFVNFEVLTNEEGVFESRDILASVESNVSDGFQLYLSSTSEDPDLKHNKGADDVISTKFNGSVTSSTMQDNTWGYSLDSTNYTKVPGLLSPVVISSSQGFTTDQSKLKKNLTFGFKLSNSLAAGVYRGAVKLTLISGGPSEDDWEVDFTTFSGIRFMHQLTPEICAAETTPNVNATELTYYTTDDTNYVPTNYLRDIRDGKFYLVSKLADGNCWMDEGLRYLPSSTSTNEYTDLNTKSEFEYTEFRSAYGSESLPWDDQGYKTAMIAPLLPSRGSGVHSIAYSYSDYPDVYHDPVGYEHDVVKSGYRYNWFAATAGNKTSTTTAATANDSVCPKNWRLPTATGQKSFDNLITVYGVKFNYEENGYETEEDYEDAVEKLDKITSSPLFFKYGGRYYNYSGNTSSGDYCLEWDNGGGTWCVEVGYKAYYWTADTMTKAQANILEDEQYKTHNMGAAKLFYFGEYSARILDDPIPEYITASEQVGYPNIRLINGYPIRCVVR